MTYRSRWAGSVPRSIRTERVCGRPRAELIEDGEAMGVEVTPVGDLRNGHAEERDLVLDDQRARDGKIQLRELIQPDSKVGQPGRQDRCRARPKPERFGLDAKSQPGQETGHCRGNAKQLG